VTARVVGDAELHRGQARERELTVIGVAAAGVLDPTDGAAAGADDRALDAAPRAGDGRAEVERAAAPDLVEREHEAQVAPASLDAWDGGERAEVVGRTGVGPLFGARCDQPDVAGGPDGWEPRSERDEGADPGRVVVGAGRWGDGVDVGDEDDEALRRRVVDADDVA
jgi:hypothetical protein